MPSSEKLHWFSGTFTPPVPDDRYILHREQELLRGVRGGSSHQVKDWLSVEEHQRTTTMHFRWSNCTNARHAFPPLCRSFCVDKYKPACAENKHPGWSNRGKEIVSKQTVVFFPLRIVSAHTQTIKTPHITNNNANTQPRSTLVEEGAQKSTRDSRRYVEHLWSMCQRIPCRETTRTH